MLGIVVSVRFPRMRLILSLVSRTRDTEEGVKLIDFLLNAMELGLHSIGCFIPSWHSLAPSSSRYQTKKIKNIFGIIYFSSSAKT